MNLRCKFQNNLKRHSQHPFILGMGATILSAIVRISTQAQGVGDQHAGVIWNQIEADAIVCTQIYT